MARHNPRMVFEVPDLPGMRFPWYTRMPVELWRPLRQYVYERDAGCCQYCGRHVELNTCHIHHVLELSKMGTNHPSNLKTLCCVCHRKRHPHMQDGVENLGISLCGMD